MRYLILLFSLAMLAGCESAPVRHTQPVLDANGNVQFDKDGEVVKATTWKSQKTIKYENKLEFINLQLIRDAGAADTPPVDPTAVCAAIPKPTSDTAGAWEGYYQAIQLCVVSKGAGGGGGGLTREQYAGIRGEPANDGAYMFHQMEKTEQVAIQESGRKLDRWLNFGLGVAGLGVQLYDIEHGGKAVGSGGIYVDGDVVTEFSGSNSGTQGGGENAGGYGQQRQMGQTVFGNNNNAIADNGSRQSATGFGPSQQLETSANGTVAQDSELKGVWTADEYYPSGDTTYDDGGDGINFSLGDG